jgi:predicted ATPase
MLQGAFLDAWVHLAKAIDAYDLEWDNNPKFRLFPNIRITAIAYLALVSWHSGDFERARGLIERALKGAVESGHVQTLVFTYTYKAALETFRGDAVRTLHDAETLFQIAEKNEMALFASVARAFRGWARARLGDSNSGLEELRQGLAECFERNTLILAPFWRGLLAELEAAEPAAGGALMRIEGAVALSEQTGERWTDAFLHRVRGDILLKVNSDSGRTEEAYRAAIAIAKRQGARSYELLASLSLAKLCQSTGRPLDANAILAPALEGFSSTPEIPEIAEAQVLLAALA